MSFRTLAVNGALSLLLAGALSAACSNDAASDDTEAAGGASAEADSGPEAPRTEEGAEDAAPPEPDEPRVGYEILNIISPSEIVVWISTDLTPEEFEALELPGDWFKNQPREGTPDGASFARSPDAAADGEFRDEELFGHVWRHNATVIEANTPLDDAGLLRLSRVAKFHDVNYDAGRTLKILVSPEDDPYVLISRDAGRTSEVPTIPDPWRVIEYVAPEDLTFQLPNPTDNIRADNEDSFQGPVEELRGVVAAGTP
jgi:hypothetical protein